MATLPALKIHAAAAASVALPAAVVPAAKIQLRGMAQALHKDKESGRSRDGSFGQVFDGSAKKETDVGAFRIPSGTGKPVDLDKLDPSWAPGFRRTGKHGNKGSKRARKLLGEETARLQELQNRLWAGRLRRRPGRYHSVLIVLQGMDTGGKDGTIRYVLGPLNPQGMRVYSFGVPTPVEIKKGYMWRVRRRAPKGKGEIVVFNRSQYEDILVPTVKGTHRKDVIERRYDEINAWEQELDESGVLVLKFFLNISKEEQKRRLQERLDDPKKQWKFSPDDLKSRKDWDKYRGVYSRILSRTSTEHAPWYVIPADNKWFRNYAAARIIREAMDGLDLRYPDPPPGLGEIVIP